MKRRSLLRAAPALMYASRGQPRWPVVCPVVFMPDIVVTALPACQFHT